LSPCRSDCGRAPASEAVLVAADDPRSGKRPEGRQCRRPARRRRGVRSFRQRAPGDDGESSRSQGTREDQGRRGLGRCACGWRTGSRRRERSPAMADPIVRVARTIWNRDGFASAERAIPNEVAIAITYGGSTQAVMMATPSDLEDFAVGFSLTEGLIWTPA